MSKDSKLDILGGGSHLPSDLLTPSLGSNYGMDGYPDMQYGLGVLEGDLLSNEAASLPDGIIGVSKAGADEMDLTEMIEESPLSELSWLDDSMQDIERLPETPESIPELEQAWGDSTNGITTHPREIKRARYEDALEDAPKARLGVRALMRIGQAAMRRSMEKKAIGTVVKTALESAGEENVTRGLLAVLSAVKEDHGLAGNVFIRSAAYPSWGAGKWKKHSKKFASEAKFIIVSQEELRNSTWIQNGRCSYTGKTAVTEIPWKEALAHYAPRLAATGRKVAGSNPKEALRAAFLSNSVEKKVASNHPVEKREGSFDIGSRLEQQYDLGSSVQIDTSTKVSEVDWGVGTASPRISSSEEITKAAVSATSSEPIFTESTRSPVKMELSEENASIARVAAESGVPGMELRGMLRFARKAMSEGFAGSDLTSYLNNRFTNRVVAAGKNLISDARQTHEGLSGFVYVDAEAYVTEGVKGCKQGGLRHRANQIRNVRAMSRCNTCSLARACSDGTRKCAAYNKTLVLAEEVSGPELGKIKAANIHSADMSDAETTASLFAPSFDAGEFGLVNTNLEAFDYDPLPETEKLAGILFDGWDMGNIE